MTGLCKNAETKIKKEEPDQEELGVISLRKRKIVKNNDRLIANRKKNKSFLDAEVNKRVKKEPIDAVFGQKEQSKATAEEAQSSMNNGASTKENKDPTEVKKIESRKRNLLLLNADVKKEVKEERVDDDAGQQARDKSIVPQVKDEPLDAVDPVKLENSDLTMRDDVTQVSTTDDELNKESTGIRAEKDADTSIDIFINATGLSTEENSPSKELRDDQTQVSITEHERIMNCVRDGIEVPNVDEADSFMNDVGEQGASSSKENINSSHQEAEQENPMEMDSEISDIEVNEDTEKPESIWDTEQTTRPEKTGRFECFKCDKKYKLKQSLQRHNMVHLGDRPFCCLKCDMKFYRLDHLTSHKRTHDGEKPYSCNICNAEFARKTDLNKHERRHDKSPQYSCKICGLKFREAARLKCHLLTHKGLNDICCIRCHETFSSSEELNEHKKECKPEETTPKKARRKSKQLKCVDCNKCFFDTSSLNKHKQIHSDIKPYECDICKKPFHQLANMKNHRNTHLDSEIKSKIARVVQTMKISP